jgi:hypothetical protein
MQAIFDLLCRQSIFAGECGMPSGTVKIARGDQLRLQFCL